MANNDLIIKQLIDIKMYFFFITESQRTVNDRTKVLFKLIFRKANNLGFGLIKTLKWENKRMHKGQKKNPTCCIVS